ncbi:MAG: tannase/feruloyl esterase family alpha/beta hydrolase [Novosphingobium sp.]
MNFQVSSPSDLEEALINCTAARIQRTLSHLGAARVVSATVNSSGAYQLAPTPSELPQTIPSQPIEGLPPFCDVRIEWRGNGNPPAHITVWVPLEWNGRFIGTLGAGNRTQLPAVMPPNLRVTTLSSALRDRFAAASTDGGNRDSRLADWGLLEGTREIDWQLTENWVHRSTHEMTLVAKAVIRAIHGSEPKYSYAIGSSGGGRQALVAAQRYPSDYNGVWTSDPAINWTRAIPAMLWPALVMNELGALGPAKLEAFRQAAVTACAGTGGLRDSVLGSFDPCDFDPHRMVGTDTAEGHITERDAEVMARIWQGPRSPDGSFLWFGLRPGAESWGNNALARGLCMTEMVGGVRRPIAFPLAVDYLKAWVLRDPDWDWRTLELAGFADLFERSVSELPYLAADDADLSAFRTCGGRIIMSHGADDEVLPAAGTISYYRQVIEATGSLDATREFARLFVSEGDGHSAPTERGPGLRTAEPLAALIDWVEHNRAPDSLIARKLDPETGRITASKPVYAYPFAARYAGGPPDEAESYEPHFEQDLRSDQALADRLP